MQASCRQGLAFIMENLVWHHGDQEILSIGILSSDRLPKEYHPWRRLEKHVGSHGSLVTIMVTKVRPLSEYLRMMYAAIPAPVDQWS